MDFSVIVVPSDQRNRCGLVLGDDGEPFAAVVEAESKRLMHHELLHAAVFMAFGTEAPLDSDQEETLADCVEFLFTEVEWPLTSQE
jgi:hypothetical protein